MDSKRCKSSAWDALPLEIQVGVLEMLDLASIARVRAVHKGCLHASKLIRKLHGTSDGCIFCSSKDNQLQVSSLSIPKWKLYSTDVTKDVVGNLVASAGTLLCFHNRNGGAFSILDTIDNSVINIPRVPGHSNFNIYFVGLVASNRKFEALVCQGIFVERNVRRAYLQARDRFYCHVYNGSAWDTSLVHMRQTCVLVLRPIMAAGDKHFITTTTLHGSSLYFTVRMKTRALEVKFTLHAYDFYNKEIIKITTWGNELGFLQTISGLGLEPKPVVVDGQLFLVGLDESSDVGKEICAYRFKLFKFDFTNKAWKMMQHAEMEYKTFDPHGFDVTGSGTKICINLFHYLLPLIGLLVYDTGIDFCYPLHTCTWKVGRLI